MVMVERWGKNDGQATARHRFRREGIHENILFCMSIKGRASFYFSCLQWRATGCLPPPPHIRVCTYCRTVCGNLLNKEAYEAPFQRRKLGDRSCKVYVNSFHFKWDFFLFEGANRSRFSHAYAPGISIPYQTLPY